MVRVEVWRQGEVDELGECKMGHPCNNTLGVLDDGGGGGIAALSPERLHTPSVDGPYCGDPVLHDSVQLCHPKRCRVLLGCWNDHGWGPWRARWAIHSSTYCFASRHNMPAVGAHRPLLGSQPGGKRSVVCVRGVFHHGGVRDDVLLAEV